MIQIIIVAVKTLNLKIYYFVIYSTLNELLFVMPWQHDNFMYITPLSTNAVLLASISRNCYRFNMAKNSENMRGAALMTGSMVGFTVNDAFMKALSSDIPLFQALLLRGLGTVVFLVVLAILRKQFRFDFKSKDWVLIVLRCLAEVMGTVFFLTALFHMPIANVTAVLQALPLTVALAGAVFLREPVGWRRLLAILVGLVGVVLIVRPGGDGFTVYSVYALGAVVCITLRDLVVRRMSHDIPSIIVGLMAAIAVTLAGAVVTATQPWVPVDGVTAIKLVGAMVFIIFGYIFSVAAMRVGEISFVSPFRYSGLLAALVLGWIVFGDWPVPLTLLGATIVVVTGLFTIYRERQHKLKKES